MSRGLDFTPNFFVDTCDVSIFLFLFGGNLKVRLGCFSEEIVSSTVMREIGARVPPLAFSSLFVNE